MKKRILGLILAMVTCIVFCFGLVGCNKCSHTSKTLIEDTATCENNGIATYKCNDCGEIIKEDKIALGHDFELVSNTTSCTTDGVITNKCKRCNFKKSEQAKATGHNYNEDAYCKICSKFKFDIELSVKLPVELKYLMYSTNYLYAKCELTRAYLYISSTNYLFIELDGKKTYDSHGDYGDSAISFTVVLKEKTTQSIIDSANILIRGLLVSQSFSHEFYKITYASNLDTNKQYILEIVDRKI